jgi:predicted site-specific integrase-resolvase
MIMNKKLVKIGEAAKLLGTSPDTLRKWEVSGELLPKRKTKGGTRYYDVAELLNLGDEDTPTVCYIELSEYLQRQQEMLEMILKTVLEIKAHVTGT